MGRHLSVDVSESLWNALRERSRMSGQSVSHIVQGALAEALDVEHRSLFQVSTSGAVVDGLYDGCVTVADLRRHGTLGVGTFEDLDGEMIILDGHCYQALADGSVVEAADDVLTPFATVVDFAPDSQAEVTDVTGYDSLTSALDQLRASDNQVVAIRASGTFTTLRLRCACRTESGVDLVTATAGQAEFELTDVAGTLVGFWSPAFLGAIAIEGYHLHFISDDHRHAGHLLDGSSAGLSVQTDSVSDLGVAMPETEQFLSASLRADPAGQLRVAEGERTPTTP